MNAVRSALAATILAVTGGTLAAQEYSLHERYIPTGPNGYIYEAEQRWTAPPLYGPTGYYGSPYVYGPAYDLPPYGFGSRYYNGYNDPALPTYGPGVQEFIHFGGADFYGW